MPEQSQPQGAQNESNLPNTVTPTEGPANPSAAPAAASAKPVTRPAVPATAAQAAAVQPAAVQPPDTSKLEDKPPAPTPQPTQNTVQVAVPAQVVTALVDSAKVPTKKYQFTGKNHWHLGQKLEAGQVVDLTETQAYAFRDKFKLVEQQ